MGAPRLGSIQRMPRFKAQKNPSLSPYSLLIPALNMFPHTRLGLTNEGANVVADGLLGPP
jgi:hypothetical protein